MKRVYKLFVASPSDLEAERQEIPRIVNRINVSFGLRWNIFVQLVMWETSVHSGIGEDAQDVINRQVPEDYDIFLGMFWNRVGTKTKRAASGTMEEYERALNRYVRTGKPEIMVFFKDSASSSQENSPQRKAMLRLRKRIGQDNVMFSTFQSTPQFAEILYDQLLMVLAEFSHGTKQHSVLRSYTIGDKGQKVPVKQSANVALVYKNRVLLVKRSRQLKVGPGLWQLPGGKLEPREKPDEAALREMQEELGLELDEDALQPVASIHSQSLGDREGEPIQIHLFYCELAAMPNNFSLEDSIERIQWVSFSALEDGRHVYMGDTRQLLKLAKRYRYAYLPLEAIQKRMLFQPGAVPNKVDGLSSETTQTLLATLDVLGFVNSDRFQLKKAGSRALWDILLEWCKTNRSVFEPEGFSDWQTNMLLINDGEKVLQYQKTLFERHESLAALLSYKLSKVVSRRNVCDVLLFGRIGEKFYILLRWDYVANKYQIPAKGLEDQRLSLYSEEYGKYVVSDRISPDLTSAFEYFFCGHFTTSHLSSGGVHDLKLIREYKIILYLLRAHEEKVGQILAAIRSMNFRAGQIVTKENVSLSSKDKAVSLRWVPLDKLLENSLEYCNKKVQGFAEILDYLGKRTILEMANLNGIDFLNYRGAFLDGEFD